MSKRTEDSRNHALRTCLLILACASACTSGDETPSLIDPEGSGKADDIASGACIEIGDEMDAKTGDQLSTLDGALRTIFEDWTLDESTKLGEVLAQFLVAESELAGHTLVPDTSEDALQLVLVSQAEGRANDHVVLASDYLLFKRYSYPLNVGQLTYSPFVIKIAVDSTLPGEDEGDVTQNHIRFLELCGRE